MYKGKSNERIDRLQNRLRVGVETYQGIFDSLQECDEAINVNSRIVQPGEAQLTSPDAWQAVETVAPRLISQKPTVIFKPEDDGEVIQDIAFEKAENQNQLFNYWWTKDSAFNKVVRWTKGTLTHGTKHVRVYWKTVTREVQTLEYDQDGYPVVDPASVKYKTVQFQDELGNVYETQEPVLDDPENPPKFVTNSEMVTVFDDPTFEVLDSYNIIVDPSCRDDVQNAQWILIHYMATEQELLANARLRPAKSKIKAYFKDNYRKPGTNKFWASELKQARIDSDELGGIDSTVADDTVNRTDVVEMWEVQNGKMMVSTILGGCEEIDYSKNPYFNGKYPVVEMHDSLLPDRYLGVGEIEPLLPYFNAISTIISMDMSNRVELMAPMKKVYGDVDESELVPRPHGIIHLPKRVGGTAMDDVENMVATDLTQTNQAALDMYRRIVQNSLGMYDYTGGIKTGSNTLGEVNQVSEDQNARFSLKKKHVQDALSKLAMMVMDLYQQYQTKEMRLRVTGEDGVETTRTILPADIAARTNAIVEDGSTVPSNDQQAKQENAMALYKLFADVEDLDFKKEIEKMLLRSFDGGEALIEPLEKAYAKISQTQGLIPGQFPAQQGFPQVPNNGQIPGAPQF